MTLCGTPWHMRYLRACLLQAWPSTIRTVFGDQERYETTYFAPFKDYYFTGSLSGPVCRAPPSPLRAQ